MNSPTLPRVPRAQGWLYRGKLLETVTFSVIAVAILVDGISVVFGGFALGGILSFTATAAGVALGNRHPYPGLALVAIAPVLAAAFGWDPTANWSIACFAAFVLALRGASGIVVGAIIAVANLAAVGISEGTLDVAANPAASIAAFAAAAAAAAGSAVRESRRYWAELEQRTRDAIATREAAVNTSVAEERLRIARDLHDSIGHEIAVVNMHLGAAEVHLERDVGAVGADLAAAQRSVKAVLRETQEILHVLRVGTDTASLEPTPHHGRIADLVESFRAAGLSIEAALGDLSVPLPATVSVAAYRITQEALTNAQKHGTGPVSLRVDLGDRGGPGGEAVVIEVVNMKKSSAGGAGAGAALPGGGGNGLVGMRERATSVGGRIDIRSEKRMFWLTAHLPAAPGENK